jgi:hypothetical protein
MRSRSISCKDLPLVSVYLAPEVEQRDQGEGAEQEEHPHSADRVLDSEERVSRKWITVGPGKREWPYKL